MYIKINPPKDYNKGSCAKLAEYLEKENEKLDIGERQMFFDQQKEDISYHQVINDIDSNKACLKRDEDKYYMISINPSAKELSHICKEISGRNITELDQLTKSERLQYENALKEYARNVMDEYAKNFNKGLTGNDILYFGKVEHFRYYKSDDTALLADRKKHIKLSKEDIPNLRYNHIYYADREVQKISHGLKVGNPEDIKRVAKEMASLFPDNASLVPMPSSCGYATYTKTLSEEIAKHNPNLVVQDIMQGTQREKLFDVKKRGDEVGKDYFNFTLNGSVLPGRDPYFVDNVLSTGTTFVNAKEAIPNAKLAVYGCNEEALVKAAKLDQVENIEKSNLPQAGDRKPGLNSHIHIIVSRKDITNTIRLSPFANARDAQNEMPNGQKAQIGFDREKFPQSCEKRFDNQFGYKRDIYESYQNRLLASNISSKLTTELSKQAQKMLPEELSTVGKNAMQAARIIRKITKLSQDFSNQDAVEYLSKNQKHLNQLQSSSDTLRVQAIILTKEFNNFGRINNDFYSKITDHYYFQRGLINNTVLERKNAVKRINDVIKQKYSVVKSFTDTPLWKEIEHKQKKWIPLSESEQAYLKDAIKAFADLKESRNEKLEIIKHWDSRISSMEKNINTHLEVNNVNLSPTLRFDQSNTSKVNYLSPNFNQLVNPILNHPPISHKIISQVQAVGKDIQKTSDKLLSFQRAINKFLENSGNLSDKERFSELKNVKGLQFGIYEARKEIDAQQAKLQELKNDLWKEIKHHKAYVQSKYDGLTGDKSYKNEQVKRLLATHENVKKEVLTKIDYLNRASRDLNFQKGKLNNVSSTLSNLQRPLEPFNLIKATLQEVPVARDVVKAISYAANPTKLAVDVALKPVTLGLSTGAAIL